MIRQNEELSNKNFISILSKMGKLSESYGTGKLDQSSCWVIIKLFQSVLIRRKSIKKISVKFFICWQVHAFPDLSLRVIIGLESMVIL